MSANSQSSRQRDWFLIGIVVGVLALVVVAVLLVLREPGPQTYQPEDTPDGIAINYLIAVQEKDYDRAYGYLDPAIPGYPADAEAYFVDVRDNFTVWDCPDADTGGSVFAVDDTEIFGDRAIITLNETTYTSSRDLFSSGRFTRSYDIDLVRANETWRITHSDRCWHPEWSDPPDQS